MTTAKQKNRKTAHHDHGQLLTAGSSKKLASAAPVLATFFPPHERRAAPSLAPAAAKHWPIKSNINSNIKSNISINSNIRRRRRAEPFVSVRRLRRGLLLLLQPHAPRTRCPRRHCARRSRKRRCSSGICQR